LNSFFEVNQGIARTTSSFDNKNAETYQAFEMAAQNNPEKYRKIRDKARVIHKAADEIVMYIQEMKYDLVSKCDGEEVYLGTAINLLDEDGDPKEEMAIKETEFNKLTPQQKSMPIGWLDNKSDRSSSGQLFFPNDDEGTRASILKKKIENYKVTLTKMSNGNKSLVANINLVCDVSDKKRTGEDEKWEEYNFVDMPSVGALTILSKIQSDLRNIEADLINYLKRDIEDKLLKFGGAEGIQIPKTNFVLRGDSFRAEVFITAKNPGQDPDIYVGEYDSLGGGNYEMRGEYETLKVINGKGIFAKRTTVEGLQKWGGLIAMKTETGTKLYPFKGEYLVAAKTAIVSPTKLLILYTGLEAIGGNPIKVSVPGYTASEITPRMSNGTLKLEKKSEGMYSAFPNVGTTSAIITLYANVDGKQAKIGKVDFRVTKPPSPSALIRSIDANGLCDRSTLKNEIVQATLDNFLFDGLKYKVTSFKLAGVYKGAPISCEQKNGMGFTDKMKAIITNSTSGSTINISKIKAKLIGSKLPSKNVIGDLVIEIK